MSYTMAGAYAKASPSKLVTQMAGVSPATNPAYAAPGSLAASKQNPNVAAAMTPAQAAANTASNALNYAGSKGVFTDAAGKLVYYNGGDPASAASYSPFNGNANNVAQIGQPGGFSHSGFGVPAAAVPTTGAAAPGAADPGSAPAAAAPAAPGSYSYNPVGDAINALSGNGVATGSFAQLLAGIGGEFQPATLTYDPRTDPTQNSQYASDLLTANTDLSKALIPLGSQYNALYAAGPNGQNLYQQMQASIDNQVQNAQLGDQDALAARGITSSGQTSADISNIAAQYQSAYQQANQSYGTDVNDPGSAAFNLKQQIQNGLLDYETGVGAAKQSALATAVASPAALTTPLDSSPGVVAPVTAPAASAAPAASPWVISGYKGPAGFFAAHDSPSGYRYINSDGHIVNAAAKPTASEKLIANPIPQK